VAAWGGGSTKTVHSTMGALLNEVPPCCADNNLFYLKKLAWLVLIHSAILRDLLSEKFMKNLYTLWF
jgi:hypothetical protein